MSDKQLEAQWPEPFGDRLARLQAIVLGACGIFDYDAYPDKFRFR